MKQITLLRKEIASELSLPKEWVDDVLSFSYLSLLKAFHVGGKIEMSGLGTFINNRQKLYSYIRTYENVIPSKEEGWYKDNMKDNLILLYKLRDAYEKNGGIPPAIIHRDVDALPSEEAVLNNTENH